MSMKQAVDLYTSFREKRPTKLARIPIDLPKVVAAIGHVESLDYRTTHGNKVTLYRHTFAKGSRPILAVSGNGKQLMLLGGRYEFTDRGIVDKDKNGDFIDNPKHGRSINPKTPAHICPICNKPGGAHVPHALDALRLPGEYAHPRCVEKAFGRTKGSAPAGAVTKDRAFYFDSYTAAQQYAVQHGYPTGRIRPYSSGWTVQVGKKGRGSQQRPILAGNPKVRKMALLSRSARP